MTYHLLFVHGWGFDASFWHDMQSILPQFETSCLDLGFFKERPATDFSSKNNKPVIAIGHSFGLLWLANQTTYQWAKLISINGFTCFRKKLDFPEGTDIRKLQLMKSNLASNPLRTINNFRQSAGGTRTNQTPVQSSLTKSLADMAEWDQRHIIPKIALCGESDTIVPASMSRACFTKTPICWHKGGHLLPLEDPRWCVQQIIKALES